jgi:anti-sigma factor RsiW
MRCSSCEPLLDAYLENALPPRQMRAVATHVRRCRSCEALLAELRVVDALLTTASPPGGVGSDFTAAVVSAMPQAPQPAPRRIPLWIYLALYLALGWIAFGVTALLGYSPATLLSATLASSMRTLFAIGTVVSALSPGAPVLAAWVSCVLLLDVALLAIMIRVLRWRNRA